MPKKAKSGTMSTITIWNDGGIKPKKQVKGIRISQYQSKEGQAKRWRIINTLVNAKNKYETFKERSDAVARYDQIVNLVNQEGKQFSLTPSERTAITLWRSHRAARLKSNKESMTLDKAIMFAIESENEKDEVKLLVFDLLRDFEKFKEKEALSKGTRQALAGFGRMMAKVKRFLEPLPDDTPLTIFNEREHLEELEEELHAKIKGRNGEGPSQGTKIDYRKKLSIFINWLVKNGHLQRNMVDSLHKITAVEPPMEIYTIKEMRQLLELAREHLSHAMPWLIIGGFCGVRRRELTRIKWSDIDLDERIIRIEASVAKMTQRRIVPIPDMALLWLQDAFNRGVSNSGYILPYETEQRREEGQSRHIKRLGSLGFTWKRNALRHSAASYACAYSGNYNEVANWMGHDYSTLKRHYRSVVSEREAKGWYELNP